MTGLTSEENLKPPVRCTSESDLRVLVLAPRGAGTHYNGAGTTFYRMYSHPLNQKIKVSLVHGSSQQAGGECYETVDQLNNIRGAVSKLAFIQKAKRWLRQNKDRFDVLHSITAFQPGMRPAFFAESIGLPAVVTVAGHRSDLGGRASWISRMLRSPQSRARMAAGVSAMVATSEDIFQELLEVGVPKQKIYRIPYGVDTEQFKFASANEKSSLRRELKIPPDLPTIVFVGDAIRRKRPMLILQAMAEIFRLGKKIQVLFVGPTTDADYLRQMQQFIRENDLESFVHWVGFQKNVQKFLRASDVFVLFSQGEGLPNAMLEAMACGLPVVGTAISGIRDLIEEGSNGFIVPPDVESVTRCLMEMLDQQETLKDLGRNSRQIIDQRYALNVVIPKYEQLFCAVARK